MYDGLVHGVDDIFKAPTTYYYKIIYPHKKIFTI